MHSNRIRKLLCGLAIAAAAKTGTVGFAPSGWAADVNYAIDDGSAERAIGIDPGEDTLWFNTFPVQPGGEVIDSISVAFGRPGITQALNGLPILILLYEDADGGDPWNAVLKQSLNALSANANTNTLNVYNITPTEIHGTLLAAVIYRNTTSINRFISSSDETAPTLANRSYYGFTVDDMNQNDLSSIPVSQRGTLESIVAGNWLVRAHGSPVPEPASASGAVLAVLACAARRRRISSAGE
ncbi:PEP-CTERM sorting domain-containing protein [soil metagenome]